MKPVYKALILSTTLLVPPASGYYLGKPFCDWRYRSRIEALNNQWTLPLMRDADNYASFTTRIQGKYQTFGGLVGLILGAAGSAWTYRKLPSYSHK